MSSPKMESMQVAYGDEITADASQLHVNCFGCCCDFRKAVIAVNSVMLGFQVISMALVAVMLQGQDVQVVGAAEAIVFIGVIFTSLGIFGALKFNKCAVITTSVFYSLSVLVHLLAFNLDNVGQSLLNLILPGLFLYPHVYFLILMDKGIMTEENYHRVAKCC